MNQNYVYGAIATALLAGIGLIVLFWIQNIERMTQLSLNVYFVAIELSQPVPIPVLIAACLGIGFVLGTLALSMRNASKAKKLKREIALSGGGDQDAWRS